MIRESDGMSRVKISNEKDDWLGTEYWIDGNKVPWVRSVDFHVAVDEVPTFKFETLGKPDIDMPSTVVFDFSPENLSDACLIVSEELEKHGDFYKAFVESVLSVLKEVPDGTEIWLNELAEKIVQRIAGEE